MLSAMAKSASFKGCPAIYKGANVYSYIARNNSNNNKVWLVRIIKSYIAVQQFTDAFPVKTCSLCWTFFVKASVKASKDCMVVDSGKLNAMGSR